MTPSISKIFSIALLLIFIAIEYCFRNRIDSIAPYAMYSAELIFIAFTWLLLRKSQLLKTLNVKKITPGIMIALIAGLGVRLLCTPLHLFVPFDLSVTENIILLLAAGPILEELLFRGAFWRILEEWISSQWIILFISAVVFSFSHYQAIFETPVEVHAFIQYQTLYTFLLALFCGYYRSRYGLFWAILIHVFFNLGFFIANR